MFEDMDDDLMYVFHTVNIHLLSMYEGNFLLFVLLEALGGNWKIFVAHVRAHMDNHLVKQGIVHVEYDRWA